MNITTMIAGLGVDLVHISRLSRLLSKGNDFSERLFRRILHPREISQLNSLNQDATARFIAGSWAAKEAVFKTLDEEDQKTFQFNQWYRFKNGKKPGIGSDTSRDSFLLSISHDNDMLIATVLRQTRS